MQSLLSAKPQKWFLKWLRNIQTATHFLLLIAIAGFLGIAWWRYQNTVFVIKDPLPRSEPSAMVSAEVFVPAFQPSAYYVGMAEVRDLFRLYPAADSVTEDFGGEIASSVNHDIAGRFVVQGIVHDRNPMAIIKDTQTNKTHFLHRSQVLEGAKLMDIKGNRVIFERGGEVLELIKK